MRWHRFERGPLAGNFLHEQLEWLAHEAFALADDSSLAERLRRRCERAGRGAQADDVIAWLSAWMHQPLTGPGVPLPHLHRLLPEMEFWLPAAQLPAATVDALCRRHLLRDLAPEAPRPTLVARELHGLVMGFADLVFEHDGRYWVLDYKSNQLGPEGSAYTAAALTEAMALHRYDVQAALYLLALHRLLRQRLGDAYDPASQLGGAIYLFLRGLDGPVQGQHLVPPDLALLEALDALLTQEATA
jgi:exodeoxyribonuclease V beta subunit